MRTRTRNTMVERKDDDFLTLQNCPVCSSSSLRSFRSATFDFRRISRDQLKATDSEYGKIWDLSRCSKCRFVFANPLPGQTVLDFLYGAVEDPDYDAEAGGRGKNFSRILKRLERLHPGKGRLLDVGAATGILMKLARDRGWIPEGLEPSAWAVKTARENYGVDIHLGSFGAVPLEAGSYDAVTMVDFIEHVPEPYPAVDLAHSLLSSNGLLCLVTPDIESAAARLMSGRWWHYRPGHLGYFSRASLSHLLKRAGFRMIASRRYSWSFSAHYILSRFSRLHFLLRNPRIASFFKRIPIKLALQDSLEVYAVKDQRS